MVSTQQSGMLSCLTSRGFQNNFNQKKIWSQVFFKHLSIMKLVNPSAPVKKGGVFKTKIRVQKPDFGVLAMLEQ